MQDTLETKALVARLPNNRCWEFSSENQFLACIATDGIVLMLCQECLSEGVGTIDFMVVLSIRKYLK